MFRLYLWWAVPVWPGHKTINIILYTFTFIYISGCWLVVKVRWAMSIYQDKTLTYFTHINIILFVCVRLQQYYDLSLYCTYDHDLFLSPLIRDNYIPALLFFLWSTEHWQTFGRNISSYTSIRNLEGNGVFLRKISSYLYEKNKLRNFFIKYELNVSQIWFWT